MKKVLLVFDEENAYVGSVSEIKEMFLEEETEITAIPYDNDFYCYARSEHEKEFRETQVKKALDMIRAELSGYKIDEKRITDWTADQDILDIACKKSASVIAIVGNTKKMRKMAHRINKKSNIMVTLIPERGTKAA